MKLPAQHFIKRVRDGDQERGFETSAKGKSKESLIKRIFRALNEVK